MENIKELPTQIEEVVDKICLKLNEIEIMQEKLKEAESDKSKWLSELADLLDTSGYKIGSKMVLKNGRKLSLKEFFAASIPSKSAIDKCKDPEKQQDLIARKEECLLWLDENGLSDIIKNNIIAMLPRGNQELANDLEEKLSELSIAYSREESVHAQTLKATLKETLKQGKNIPFDTFDVQTGTTVEIK